jgi:hypothetical protein
MDYNTSTTADLVIHVKDYAVGLLKDLFNKYEIKYPSFKVQLLEVFKANLDKSSLFTIYGVVKGINALGPAYVMDIILPKLDGLSKKLHIDHQVITEINKVVPSEHMQVDGEAFITLSQNIPGTLQMPIASSMFSEISHTNILPGGGYESIQRRVNKDDKNAYYVYYALKESANLLIDYVTSTPGGGGPIIDKIIHCFGEDIILSSVKKEYEIGLNYIV